MTRDKGQKFSEKHGSGATVESSIKDKIMEHAKENKLPCAVAFKIGAQLKKTPAEIGKTLDLMDFGIIKCQLGLFGYTPNKKIVKSELPENPELVEAIRAALIDEKLSCQAAWEIADKFKIAKLKVSNACEALNIKIKPCQLGAF